MANVTANKPVHEIRMGMVKAVIWKNDSEHQGIRHNVTMQRIYKTGDGKWHSSGSFGRKDLLALARVAVLAHTWIIYQNAGAAGAETGPSEERLVDEGVHR